MIIDGAYLLTGVTFKGNRVKQWYKRFSYGREHHIRRGHLWRIDQNIGKKTLVMKWVD